MKRIILIILAVMSSVRASQEGGSTNFLTLHGFDKVHQSGLRGEGQTVIFFESNVDVQHPAFDENNVMCYDVGRNIVVNGEDKSSFRYTNEYMSFLEGIYSDPARSRSDHGNHVIGIVVGQPTLIFLGGALPGAKAINVSYSHIHPQRCWRPVNGSCYSTMGLSCYGVWDAIEKKELDVQFKTCDWEHKLWEGLPMSPLDISIYQEDEKCRNETKVNIKNSLLPVMDRLKSPADDSLLYAFQLAADLEGVAINVSAILASLCDPLNNFYMPERFIDIISESLVKKDKILVLSANNQNKRNLSDFDQQIYFKQLANHEKIGPRLLIAINVDVTNDAPYIELPNDMMVGVRLFYSSNYPGSDLKDYAVSAFGSNILSASSFNGEQFVTNSGTSQSAPMVASLCALWKQKDPSLSGVQIVQKIKDTAINLIDGETFGHGLINAWALLK